MKFYSEDLKKFYDTQEACEKAEKEFLEKKAKEEEAKKKLSTERGARAKEIEEAYNAVSAAQSHLNELIAKFLQDYKSFHFTFTDENKKKTPSFNLFDWDLF